MALRVMPGLFIAAVLGAAFCLHGKMERGHSNTVATLRSLPPGRAPASGNATFFHDRTVSPAVLEYKSILNDAEEPIQTGYALFLPIPEAGSPEAAVATWDAVPSSGEADVPTSGTGVSSDSALASFGDARAGERPRRFPPASYFDPAPKGVNVWAGAERRRERQRGRKWGQSVYSLDGTAYTAGVDYDWSVDSIVGVSFDLVDARVRSKHAGDGRHNDIDGVIANAQYTGWFKGVYPVEARLLYGRFDSKGGGRFSVPGTFVEHVWREETHHSSLFGFSFKAGAPLLWREDIKILPELGFDYRRLRTKAYGVEMVRGAPNPIVVPGTTSKSLSIPFTVTLARDFPRQWGVVTPRLAFGAAYELEKGAAGVRAYNAASASRVEYDPVANAITPVTFDPAAKTMVQIGFGLDVKTIGGWELSAECLRRVSEKYRDDTFRLELTRCF